MTSIDDIAERPNPDGFTEALERICADTCAEFGDPPCWKLPELVEPCEQITPCDECMAQIDRAAAKEASDA